MSIGRQGRIRIAGGASGGLGSRLIRHRVRRRGALVAAVALTIGFGRAALGASAFFYWDTNGSTAGAGGATPSGTWDAASNWSVDSAGAAATGSWINNGSKVAVFSAGSDATGSYTVTILNNPILSLNGITHEDGALTIVPASTQTIGLTGPTISTLSSSPLTINAPIGGTVGLAKTGTGTLVLGATNTYTGGTTVSAGTLSVSADSNLGSTSGSVTLNAGTLSVTQSFSTARGIAFSSAVTSMLDVASGRTLTYGGVISGGSGGAILYKTGAGTLILSGNSTFDINSSFGVIGGTLKLGVNDALPTNAQLNGNGSGTFDMAGFNQTLHLFGPGFITNSSGTQSVLTLTGTTAFSSSSVISGNIALVKNSSATLQLSGNNTYTGGTSLRANFIDANSANALGTGPVVMGTASPPGSGGIGLYAGTNINVPNNITVVDSPNNILILSNVHGSGPATFSGNITLQGNVSIQGLTPSAPLTLSGAIDDGAGSYSVTTFGTSGTMILSGANTFHGGLNATTGVLQLNGSQAGGAGTISVLDTTGSSNATLQLGSLTGGLNVTNPVVVRSGSTGAATIGSINTSGVNTLSGNITVQQGVAFNVGSAGGTLAVTGVISGTGNILKNGPGTLITSAVNTFTGDLTVNGGNYNLTAGRITPGTETIGLSSAGTFTQSGGTHTVGSAFYLVLGDLASGVYNLSGGSLTANGGEYVGEFTASTFSQTGGTHTINGPNYAYIAPNGSNAGVYNLSGAGVLNANSSFFVGYGGNGSFTQSGGTFNASSLDLAGSTGGVGNYNLTAGTLSVANSEYVGDHGAATFTQSGGTHTVPTLYLAYNSDATAVYNLSGGSLAVSTNEYIAQAGPATFTQTGGTHSVGTGLYVGTGNTGVYNLTSGTLSVPTGAAYFVVGSSAAGTLNLSGTGNLSVGNSMQAIVGWDGSGSIVQSGGTANIGSTLKLAFDTGFQGGYFLSNGSLTVDSEVIGWLGAGSFGQTGGAQTINGELDLGRVSGASGIYQFSGGSLSVLGGVYVGGNSSGAGGDGTFLASGGGSVSIGGVLKVWGTSGSLMNVGASTTLSANSLDLEGGDNFVSQGGVLSVGSGGMVTNGSTITLNSDTLAPGTLELNGDVTYTGGTTTAMISSGPPLGPNSLPGIIDLAGGTRTFNIADGSQSEDMIISARIIDGGLTKDGAGTLTLTGPNTYLGATTITDGQLNAAAGALPAGTDVYIGPGAILNLTGNNTIRSLAGDVLNPGAVLLNGITLTVATPADTSFNGEIHSITPGNLIKEGTGSLSLYGDLGGTTLTINNGILRVGAVGNNLGGVVTVTGTGPTYGSLAIGYDASLGSASVLLAGGHVLFENSMSLTHLVTLDVGGGTLDVSGAYDVEVTSGMGGSGSLTKAGSGTLGLGSGNSYLGQTFINAGTLATRVVNAIPIDSEVYIASGANLLLDSHNATLASIAGAGDIHVGTATLTVGGNDATTVFSGAIDGTGPVIKSGLGTLTLSGPISFGGGLTVNAGTVALAGTNTTAGGITVNAGGTVSADAAGRFGATSNSISLNVGTLAATGSFSSSNPVSIGATGGIFNVAASQTLTQHGAVTGTGAITLSGPGTLAFDTAQNESGTVTINSGNLLLAGNGTLLNVPSFLVTTGGMLELSNAATNLSNRIAGNVQLAGGAFKFDGAASTSSSETAGALSLSAGASSILLQQGSGGTTSVSFSGGVSNAVGATVDVSVASAGSTNQLFFAGQSTTPFLGGWITVNGTDFAKYDSTLGVLPLAGGDYTTTFSAGANVRLAASASAPSGVNIQSLVLDASAAAIALSQAGSLGISSGGLLKFGGNTASISGGSLTSSGGNLYVNASGGDLTISSALTGSMNLVKSGSGVLELANGLSAQNFVGGIYLDAGTLRITSDTNLGAGASGAGNDLYFNGGTLATNTFSMTLGSGRTLNFNGAGGTINVGNLTTLSLNVINQLAGTGALTKTGAGGTLDIAGSNTYAGPVTVQQGNLQLDNPGALGSGASKSTIILAPSTSLDLRSDGPFPANFGNNVIVQDNTTPTAASITLGQSGGTTPGLFKMHGLTIGNAQLNVSGTPGNSLEFNGIVTTNGSAQFNTTRDLLFSDRVTGTGSITKLGTGTLTFGSGATDTRANTYAGVTTVNGGVLQLNKAAGTTAIPGDIALGGGTIILLQPRQIADNSSLTLTGGTFNLNGQSDGVQNLTNSGATVLINAPTFSVVHTTISGGTTIIGPGGNNLIAGGSTGGGIHIPSSDDLSGQTSQLNSTQTTISDGTVTVTPGGSINVGAGGLYFTGPASPTITLMRDNTTPGKVVLNGDMFNQCTGGTASILSGGAGSLPGMIDLGNSTRTFTGSLTATLVLDGKLTDGGLRYGTGNGDSTGKLLLTTPGDFGGGTTLIDGTIEARDGALGVGPVTLEGGTLALRSDQATSSYGNDVTAFDSTIDIGRITAGTTGTLQMGALNISGSRLHVTGASGGTLQFSGGVTLAGSVFIDNTVPVTLTNSIRGSGSLTKDGGSSVLTLGGSAPNAYTGFTRVNSGTLVLGKPAGTLAVPGSLSVFTGGRVAWANSDQVADSAILNVNFSTSTMDLAGFSDTIGGMAMTSGTITTSGGVLHLNGNLSTSPDQFSATIAGNLDLGATTRTFNVGDAVGSAANDLVVSANISGAGGIDKEGAGVLVLSGNNRFTGGLNVGGGSIAFNANARLNSLTIGNGMIAGNAPGRHVIYANSLSLGATGKFDVSDGGLIVGTGLSGSWNGSAYIGVAGLIASGRNGSALPLWDGSGGIVTTQSSATGGNFTSIGVARASEVRPATATATALWGGQTITGTDTLVAYTYGGDATLDGKINIDDYIRIDAGIASGLSGWSNGDFNYDGKVNIDDYTQFIDANIGTQGAPFPTGSGITGDVSPGVSAVPEPTAITVIMSAIALSVCRRRRSRALTNGQAQSSE